MTIPSHEVSQRSLRLAARMGEGIRAQFRRDGVTDPDEMAERLVELTGHSRMRCELILRGCDPLLDMETIARLEADMTATLLRISFNQETP
jgi:hypothetical protein